MTTDMKWVRIERKLEASIQTVWNMWTQPSLFQKWYGPEGGRVPVAEMDVVVGGTRKICMEIAMPDKTMTMWFSGEYKEVNAPKRLVYTESVCDEKGNILSTQSMGMPEVTEVIVELSEVEGKTLMKLTHVGVPEGSGGEIGWNQAFDRMAAM